MTDAPKRIWTCEHVGEYGYYYPEAVEAEGEYGGKAIQYVRADIADDMLATLKSLDSLTASDAAKVCAAIAKVEVGEG